MAGTGMDMADMRPRLADGRTDLLGLLDPGDREVGAAHAPQGLPGFRGPVVDGFWMVFRKFLDVF